MTFKQAASLITDLVIDLRQAGVDVDCQILKNTVQDNETYIAVYHYKNVKVTIDIEGKATVTFNRESQKHFIIWENLKQADECIAYLRALLPKNENKAPTDLNEMYYESYLNKDKQNYK